MKTHPSHEEWMSHLYGEASTGRSAEMTAHLSQCADCRKRVTRWRAGMATLDAWPSTKAAPRPRTLAPAFQWAAAAAVMLGAGIFIGLKTSAAPARLQQLEASLRAEMESRLAEHRLEFASALEKRSSNLSSNLQVFASLSASREAGQLLAKFARSLDEQREADRDAYVSALRNLEERRATDYAALRKDLDTVAVNADDGLSRTQEQLMELATMAQPGGN